MLRISVWHCFWYP